IAGGVFCASTVHLARCLRRERTLSAQTFRTMEEMALVATIQGRIRRVNASLCTLLGYHRDELIGEPVNRILTQEDAQRLLAWLRHEGRVRDWPITYVTKNGVRKVLAINGEAIREDGKAAVGFVAIGRLSRAEPQPEVPSASPAWAFPTIGGRL